MKKIVEKILNKTPNLVIIFLYMQPLLDMIASFLIHNDISNFITSGIRILFMLYLILYLVIAKYDNKKNIMIYVSLLITYILIHTGIMYYYKDLNTISYELRNTLSTFYMVFLTITFLALYKTNKFDKNHLRNIFIIYILFTFIPGILNISYESYDHSKIGKVGWFYSANVLGSIIIILLPLVLTHLKNTKIYTKIILAIMTLYVIFTLGTKTPVLGLLVIIGLNILYFLYKIIKAKNKKYLTITISFLVAFLTGIILILPKTNFYKNINIHLNFLEKNNVSIKSKKFIDHFIFSSRLEKEESTRKYYNKSHTLEKIFGIGYIEGYENKIENYSMIEIDYFDVFYREGIIGFILFFTPIIYLLIINIKELKLNFEGVNHLVTLLLIFLLALFQGHIFVTPAISIFVSLIIVLGSVNNNKGEVKNEFKC